MISLSGLLMSLLLIFFIRHLRSQHLRTSLLDFSFGGRDHVLDRKAELLSQFLKGCGCSKSLHPDDLVVVRRVTLPSELRRLFNGDSRRYGRRDNALSIRFVLVLEDFPGGHADYPRFDTFRL